MQCPFCQTEMGNAQNACPRCGRKHAPYVAYHLNKGWGDLKRNAQTDARNAFNEALRVTPANDKQQLQSYIGYLVQQAATPAAVAGAAVASARQPAQPQPRPQSQPQPAPPQTPRAPAATRGQIGQTKPTPPQVALFFNFNEKPANIVRVMDEARQKQMQFVEARGKCIWIVPLLLLAGLMCIYLDALIGYNFFTFSLVGLVLWGAAAVSFILLMRNRSVTPKVPQASQGWRGAIVWIFLAIFGVAFCVPIALATSIFALISPPLIGTAVALIAALVSVILLKRSQPKGAEFGSKFQDARTIFETIQDDLLPKRTLMGWLDLTGLQPGKVMRQGTTQSGMPINYYRDEWLKMKLGLYDGNVMRVTVMERVKARMGRWKRGRSGKQKWKPGGTPQSRHELRVALTVNRDAYEVTRPKTAQTSKFQVDVMEASEGRIALSATTDDAIGAQDVLHILRFAYDHLKPRNAPVAAGG